MPKPKKSKKLIPILILSSIVIIAGFTFKFLFLDNSPIEIKSFNISHNRANLMLGKEKQLYINNEEIKECDYDKNENEQISSSICYTKKVKTNSFVYYEVEKLPSSTENQIVTYSTNLHKALQIKNSSDVLKTNEIPNEPIFPQRMYGRVTDQNSNGVENALVITSAEEIDLPISGDITAEDGSYSINYFTEEKEFTQKIEVISPNGEILSSQISSKANKPADDIKLTDASSSTNKKTDKLFSSIVQPAYADGNTCFSGGSLGGISVQCNKNVHWFRELNPNECPDQTKIRVGLVRHTSYTHLYEPESGHIEIYLEKLNDSGKVVGVSQRVDNGDFIATSGLETGITYNVRAKHVRGGSEKECEDINRGGPITIKLDEPTKTHGTKKIENLRKTVHPCPGLGECFGVIPAEVPTEAIIKGHNRMGMQWGEVIVVDQSSINQYRDIVKRGDIVGMRMIMRLCYKDSPCEFNNGVQFGNQIIEMYERLLRGNDVPEYGIFVHVGHNEPNTAEYKDPAFEAQFMNDAIETIADSGHYNKDTNGKGIKMISPNLDIFHKGDSDPNTYTAMEYINAMQNNGLTDIAISKLYAWSGNTHIKEGHTDISQDTRDYLDYVRGIQSNAKVIITEAGKIDGNVNWGAYGKELGEIRNINGVEAVLMFDSFGLNPEFTYHKPLWDDYKSDNLNLFETIISEAGCYKAWTDNQEDFHESNPIQIVISGQGGPIGDAQNIPPSDDAIPVVDASGSVRGIKTTSNVLKAASFTLPRPGEYLIKSKRFHITRDPYIAKFDEEDGKEVTAFYDTNKNGIKDNGEEYVQDISELRFEKVSEVSKIQIRRGHNLITLPIYPFMDLTADDLINMINNQDGNVTAVGYLSNGNWKIYNKINGHPYGENFVLMPGSGIYLMGLKDSEFALRGDKYEEPIKVYLSEGWNAVGIVGSKYDYNLGYALGSVSDIPRLKSDTISIWDEEKGTYTSFIVDGEKRFGDSDIDISEDNAIFIRVLEGGEFWKPL